MECERQEAHLVNVFGRDGEELVTVLGTTNRAAAHVVAGMALHDIAHELIPC